MADEVLQLLQAEQSSFDQFGPVERWARIVDALQILRESSRVSREDFSKCEEAMAGLLETFLQHRNLAQLWSCVLHGNSVEGSEVAISVASSFRLISNVFRGRLPAFLEPAQYSRSVMSALVATMDSIVLPAGSTPSEVLAAVLARLSDSTLATFLEHLVASSNSEMLHSRGGKVASVLDPMRLLVAAGTMLRRADGSSTSRQDAQNAHTLARLFISRALSGGVSVSEVIEYVILAKTRSVAAARVIASALPDRALPEVVDTVGLIWGDRACVSSGNAQMHNFYTEILLCALARCGKQQLRLVGSRRVPLELVLSSGISQYLDVDQISVRKHGMRVAQKYAEIMGQELSFPELALVDAADAKDAEDAEDAGAEDAQLEQDEEGAFAKSGTRGPRAATQPADDSARDAGSDSESEIGTAFDVDEEAHSGDLYDAKDRLLSTNYLRDCLTMLRCPEAKPEARQRQRAALERIPVILRGSPPDAHDLCLPLLKELLVTTNAYNLPDFDAARAAAVLSLLLSRPLLAVPFLTNSLLGDDLPIGLKLVVVEWITEAAKSLSNIPEAGILSHSAAEAAEVSSHLPGKTIIKRPAKLAASKTRTRYFRNTFAPLAHLFFYPLMQLLGSVWRSSAVADLRLASARSADEFNLISELFETDSPGSPGPAHDAKLAHIDGVAALVPAQCLVALGNFCRYCVNSFNQK
ncbi:hypothetical protein B484DRAFT_451309 [Ochromonadaceae sp. CCMP2298]|nr:hypothetical protein B484DRAFT_451309 [Ochromonadaceae sp. CCMP2298]